MALSSGVAIGGVKRPYGMPPPSWTNPSNNITGVYGAAVNKQAEDYDKIMKNYDSLLSDSRSSGNNAKINFTPISHTERPAYQQTGRLNEVTSNLSNMSRTGGYSESDNSLFRARGLAPIRSIYAQGLQNLKRQKVLQGGYSPNYGAIAAKMARESAGIIGDKNIELEANIADRVAEGKRFGVSQLAPIAQKESELTHATNTDNAANKQRVDEINQQIMMEVEKMNQNIQQNNMSQQLAATQGQANLYGTTPALVNTFGNQLLASNQQNLQGQQATANIRQDRANTGLNLVSRVAAAPRYTSGPTRRY